MTFKMYLVRHGQTIFNKYERMQGWADAPLTNKGIEDGYAAGERLANVRFDAAYSSDLSRAVHTAEYILAKNQHQYASLTPIQMAQFREEFFGSFEGLSSSRTSRHVGAAIGRDDIATYSQLMSELSQDEVMDAIKLGDPAHDAENAAEFWERLDHGLNVLRETVTDGQTILVVAHGTLIRNLTDRFASHEIAETRPDNGSVSVWEVSDTNLELKHYNDTTTVW